MVPGAECFGNPPTVQRLADALEQTATALTRLCEDSKREVDRLHPRWTGQASEAFRRHMAVQLAAARKVAGAARLQSSTMQTLTWELARALELFNETAAEVFANGFFFGPELQVVTTSGDPGALARRSALQEKVDAEKAMAEAARGKAITALQALGHPDEDLLEFLSVFIPWGKTRTGPREPLPRPRPGPVRPPVAPGRTAADWERMTKLADEARPRRGENGFAARSFRDGPNEVMIVEGKVRGPASAEDFTKYKSTLPGEHATHSIGKQLGENLPEALASAPGRELNLSPLKTVENATRSVFDRADELGATVETRTTMQLEHRMIDGEDIPVLVGVRREAWIRPPGTDDTFSFVDFEARIDPVSREVNVLKNDVVRP